MTAPVAGVALDSESVKLLRAGDVLRCIDPAFSAIVYGREYVYDRPHENDRNDIHLVGVVMSWRAERFVFVSRPDVPALTDGEDLAAKLKVIRDKFLMATPDKDYTDYAIMTRCIEALAAAPSPEAETCQSSGASSPSDDHEAEGAGGNTPEQCARRVKAAEGYRGYLLPGETFSELDCWIARYPDQWTVLVNTFRQGLASLQRPQTTAELSGISGELLPGVETLGQARKGAA